MDEVAERLMANEVAKLIKAAKKFANRAEELGRPTAASKFRAAAEQLAQGEPHVEIIATGMPSPVVQNMNHLMDIIRELEPNNKLGVPIEEITRRAAQFEIPADRVVPLLKRGSRDMGIYSPREGYWKTF